VALAVATGSPSASPPAPGHPLRAAPRGQFLIFGAGSPPLSKAVAFVGLVLVIGQASSSFYRHLWRRQSSCWTLLGLFFFVCFFVQARGTGWPCNLPLLGDRDPVTR
jgi:hypothetical protein